MTATPRSLAHYAHAGVLLVALAAASSCSTPSSNATLPDAAKNDAATSDGATHDTVAMDVVCGSNRVACGRTCVDLDSNARHCGACGNACPTEVTCVSATTSDIMLAHELNHFGNAAHGDNQQLARGTEQDQTNREEAITAIIEKSYRAERGGSSPTHQRCTSSVTFV
jgi:hypothetical protein